MRLLLIFILLLGSSSARRRSQAHRAFEDNEGIDWGMDVDDEEEENGNDESLSTSSYSSSTEKTETSTSSPTTTTTESTDDLVRQMLEGTLDVANLTKLVEKEHLKSLEDANSTLQECKAWNQHWNITVEEKDTNNSTETSSKRLNDDDMKKFLKETEVIDSKKRLKKLGMKQELLEEYEAVGIIFREVCAGHNRILWFNSTEDAKKLGIDESSPICGPFKDALNPDTEVLIKLADTLNDLIVTGEYSRRIEPKTETDSSQFGSNRSRGHGGGSKKQDGSLERKYVEYIDEEDENPHVIEHHHKTKHHRKHGHFKTTHTVTTDDGETVHVVEESGDNQSTKTTTEPEFGLEETTVQMKEEHKKLDNYIEERSDKNDVKVYDDDLYDYEDFVKRFKQPSKIIRTGYQKRRKRMAEKGDGTVEDDWVDPADGQTESEETSTLAPEERNRTAGSVQIDVTDEINPILILANHDAVSGLALNVEEELFSRHEKVGLYLPGICADYVPKAVDSFNSSSFEGVEIEGPIGVNISALEAAGVNLTELAEKLRNDTEVDDILSRTAGSVKTLGGSFILPVLNKNQYDPFSAPIVFRGSAVVVRFGIYIESMSNFQTTTMDYDMDIYLLMAWRDARLVNPYDKPILVKEEEIMEKLWRPDPFFANAKEAEFHEVTFLNFLMRIFPDGLVLYETRVKITPSCNLILCKYPHDKQTCDLLIKSFAYPVETVRFEWFSNRHHAIDKNPHVKLPELYIASYETTTCDKSRKSGTFSCLRAVFKLKRDVGFHLAQTYIPTSLALMFSWVGVWLPEEFMEGRIGVAITVLLTLSTESAGAREHLPSVSYLKAIDLWFGFITGFVFITLLQTLFVIGFDKKSSQMRKAALKKKSDITEEMREEMLYKAKRYHKIGRKLDNFCRVFYPLCFIVFLILYYFVYTEGRQDDCINRSNSFDGT